MNSLTKTETNLLNRPFVLPNGVELPNRLAKASMSEALPHRNPNRTAKKRANRYKKLIQASPEKSNNPP